MNSDVWDTIEAALEGQKIATNALFRGNLPDADVDADIAEIDTALAELRRLREADGDLREELARYAHEVWSKWMRYLFEKGGTFEKIGEYEDGKDAYAWTMTMYSVERWSRQMNTEFSALSNEEKQSDYDEADRMIAIMRLREAGPQPDWSQAPEWAEWWAVDPDGYYHWFDNEPILTEQTSHRELIGPHWSHYGRKYHLYDAVNIPLGVDWRTLIRRRTQAGRQDGE